MLIMAKYETYISRSSEKERERERVNVMQDIR